MNMMISYQELVRTFPKSCSGADVDDPDLGTNIRICYPEGNYEYNNTIYVEKRSNLLGAVVTYARTTPSRF